MRKILKLIKFKSMVRLLTLTSLIAMSGFSSAQADDNALDLAVGTWGVIDNEEDEELKDFRKCGLSSVMISIDKETMRYSAVHTGEDFTAEADILRVEERYLSIRYDDEERTMNNGKPHIWHMVFVGDDKFYWVLGPGVSEQERDGVVDAARVRCELNIA